LPLMAMTYIDPMSERLFAFVGDRPARQRMSYRRLFWVSGMGAFFLSSILGNLTKSLLKGAVVIALGAGHGRFTTLGWINLVLGADAGGVFSPFGISLPWWCGSRIFRRPRVREFLEFLPAVSVGAGELSAAGAMNAGCAA